MKINKRTQATEGTKAVLSERFLYFVWLFGVHVDDAAAAHPGGARHSALAVDIVINPHITSALIFQE
ncbi:MAG: hypothetical protein K2L21_03705, partial [Muribaculaceae bacterium]|nr:hypothetical protein [Muribaculaceae bacterium]